MTNGTHEDEYISAALAGQMLGVSTRQALRYASGPHSVIRSRQIGRLRRLHRGDVAALAEQRALPTDEGTPSRLVQPATLSVKVEDQYRELQSAAHTIGMLEERVRHLEGQLAQRPLLEDHSALKAERDALTTERDTLRRELEQTRRPWWKRLLG